MKDVRKYLARIVSGGLVFLLLFVALTNVKAQTNKSELPTSEDILVQVMSATGQSEDDFEVLENSQVRYPALNETVFVSKVYNHESDEVMTVFLDTNKYSMIERDIDAENLAAEISNGPLHPAVAARLSEASEGETITVAFWIPGEGLASPDRELVDQLEQDEQDSLTAQWNETRTAYYTSVKEDFMGNMSSYGIEADYVSPSSPLVVITATATEIEHLAQHPDVVHVFLHDLVYTDDGNGGGDPVRTIRGNRVHKFLDLSGAAQQVGILECCGPVYWSSSYAGHPFIKGINSNASAHSACASADKDHATAVAGFVASSHTEHRGLAYNAHINFDSPCNGSTAGIATAIDWLDASAGNFSDPVNHSYGLDANRVVGVSSLDAILDEKVRTSFDTHVVAAGNNCNGYGTNTCNVGSPGLAYNVITVGNIDDKQTWSWSDDSMSTSSSYIDPLSLHGDRNEPDVSAAGTQLDSAIPSSPWIGYVGTGTSFSAPTVTAAVAVLHDAGLSASWPGQIRAVLMATAWNDNADGVTGLSQKDGAGSIDAFRAAQIADDINGNSGFRSVSCTATFPITLGTFTQASGRLVRVVIAWDVNPSYADYANRPSADFDLKVTGPGGFTRWSSSWDNNYEFITFIAPSNGVYTIQVYKARCNEPTGATDLGWAWARKP